MSMHLVGPYLTTTNYRRRKTKATKSKQAQWHEDWQEKNRELKRQGRPKITYEQYVDELHGRVTKTKLRPSQQGVWTGNYQTPIGRESVAVPSKDTGQGQATLSAPKVYTGTKVKGIATMHKSNAVPVFSDEEATDISRMRRG